MRKNNRNLKRFRIEERAKYFLTNGSLLKEVNFEKLSARDFSRNKETIFIYDDNDIYNSPTKEETIMSDNIFKYKKNTAENRTNIKRVKSIRIKKSLSKFIEPKVKIKKFQQISPKFGRSIENNCTVSQILSEDISAEDIEMLEIDEKLPQEKLDKIEEIRTKINIYENFPFNYFYEIGKCYQVLENEFSDKYIQNVDNLIKYSSYYLILFMKDNNLLLKIFVYNKNVYKFILRELCFYLILILIKYFFNKLTESDFEDLKNCLKFCHQNFSYILIEIVKNTNLNLFQQQYSQYQYYIKCKMLIESQQEYINETDTKNLFHSNNKELKSLLSKILTKLSSINNIISRYIEQLFTINLTTFDIEKCSKIIFQKIIYFIK